MTEGIIERLGPLVAGHPKMIFVMAGINDLKREVPVDSVFENYKKILSMISDKSPRTKLFLQSTLPVTEAYSRREERTLEVNKKVSELNSLLKKFCTEKKINFLDLTKVLSAGNDLREELTVDGLHLNYTGYRIWATFLNSYLY